MNTCRGEACLARLLSVFICVHLWLLLKGDVNGEGANGLDRVRWQYERSYQAFDEYAGCGDCGAGGSE